MKQAPEVKTYLSFIFDIGCIFYLILVFVFYFDFSSAESMKTSDFSTEMDELFLWIDETENVLASYVTLDEKCLDETLEKIKV